MAILQQTSRLKEFCNDSRRGMALPRLGQKSLNILAWNMDKVSKLVQKALNLGKPLDDLLFISQRENPGSHEIKAANRHSCRK